MSSCGGDFAEGQSEGRIAQPVQVLVQLEDAPIVEPQALPDGVAALDDRVERADTGLVPVDSAAR